jgi:hypothetical protein
MRSVSDAFDLIVERYGGFVLVVVGLALLGAAAAGYYRYLPSPFSAPIFPSHCLGCRRWTLPATALLYLGIFCLGAGIVAMPHNRRNRAAARLSV